MLGDRRANIAVNDSAEEVAVTARGVSGDDAWQAGALREREGAEAAVAQIPDRRHPGHQVGMKRVRDGGVDRLVGHRSSPLQTLRR